MQKRIKINETQDSLQITIGPSRKRSTLILFSLLALSWVIATLAAAVEYFQTGNAAGQPLTWQRIVWWLVFGLALFYPVLTLAYGRETITINGETLLLQKWIPGWTVEKRKLELARIQDVKVFEYKGSTLSLEYSWLKWGVGGGMLAISYPTKRIYHFGRLISEQEAQQLVRQIKKYLKREQ